MFRDNAMKIETILKFIQEHQGTHVRYNKLERYYKGDNDILTRTMNDIDRPNNKVAHTFGTYITDLLVGYFMGEPVAYSYQEDNVDFKEIKEILKGNMEHEENTQLERMCSIFGKAYEIPFIDENEFGVKEINFKAINPKEVFLVHDGTINSNVNYAVRYVEMSDGYTVEIYTPEEIITYSANEALGEMTLVDSVEHRFGEVPVIEYLNKPYALGDFEKTIPLIDSYDKFVSDSLNDFDYFTNAYLAFYGVDSPDEDVSQMKQERLLFFPEGASGEFITKDLHGEEVNKHISRLEKDIHKLSKVPNLSDENFGGNASGIAMAYKMMGTENLAITKERLFKKGLQKRIKLIINHLDFVSSNSINWRDIDITFTRNVPVDVEQLAEYINKLRGLVSDETLISWLPNIENPAEEIAKRDKQDSFEENTFDFPLAE